MTLITNIQPTTELEAVNAMLSAAGEAPIAVLEGATQADVTMAVNLLRNVTREVQSMGWRFNTEHGFQVAPTTTLVWNDTAGVATTLNIFKPPTNMLAFKLTPSNDQQGSRFVDTEVRRSREYQEGNPAVVVLVFYDRALNRDGFPQSDRPYLYIDPVWGFDFEQMPEVARRFCTIRAARMLLQQGVGSETLSSFTEADEMLALRNLKREQGEEDDFNMLNSLSVLSKFGRRPLRNFGVTHDPRTSPGPV
jgi:hypothetical protein